MSCMRDNFIEAEVSALSRQRPRTVLNAWSMHSIVYVVILTREGLERSIAPK